MAEREDSKAEGDSGSRRLGGNANAQPIPSRERLMGQSGTESGIAGGGGGGGAGKQEDRRRGERGGGGKGVLTLRRGDEKRGQGGRGDPQAATGRGRIQADIERGVKEGLGGCGESGKSSRRCALAHAGACRKLSCGPLSEGIHDMCCGKGAMPPRPAS